MAGAEAQAGFYYQNIVAAQYALDLIEFGSRLRSITLENPQRAKHIDDIIVDRTEGTSFIQVKWSEDGTTAFTLHNLVTPDDASSPLIAHSHAVFEGSQAKLVKRRSSCYRRSKLEQIASLVGDSTRAS